MRNKMFEEKKKKEKLAKEKMLMGQVFGKVSQKKGSNLCMFFKAGLCNKGRKCKFSHVEETFNENQKEKKKVQGEKIDLYTDQREILFGNQDVISNWDDKKLKEVVNYNQGKYQMANTDKVCKHFLEAVEKKVYGWLWVCPNGHKCHFRHCLPKDYVFKNDQKKEERKGPSDLELIAGIDDRRNNLESKTLTPVTKELFDKWLVKRRQKLEKER